MLEKNLKKNDLGKLNVFLMSVLFYPFLKRNLNLSRDPNLLVCRKTYNNIKQRWNISASFVVMSNTVILLSCGFLVMWSGQESWMRGLSNNCALLSSNDYFALKIATLDPSSIPVLCILGHGIEDPQPIRMSGIYTYFLI